MNICGQFKANAELHFCVCNTCHAPEWDSVSERPSEGSTVSDAETFPAGGLEGPTLEASSRSVLVHEDRRGRTVRGIE